MSTTVTPVHYQQIVRVSSNGSRGKGPAAQVEEEVWVWLQAKRALEAPDGAIRVALDAVGVAQVAPHHRVVRVL